MKILFIGGTGRLSKDVASLSTMKENEVFLFTRGSKDRECFLKNSYKLIKGNIRDVENSIKTLENYKFDVIIDFLTFEVEQLKNTLKIIEGKYNQYVFISSSTVYINDNDELISESRTKVGNEKWEYAHNKFLCEEYLKEYFSNRKEHYTVIRPYVTYGNTRVPYPLVPRNNLMEWSFIDRILHNRPVPTFNKGETVTTLTHTRDFAKGVVGLFGNSKAFNEAFHITSDSTTPWGEVLDTLENILAIKITRIDFSVDKIIETMPMYSSVLLGDKSKNMRFDNSKIKEAVPDYSCNISLKDGLSDMIDFYRGHKELQKIDYMWNGYVDRLCGCGNQFMTYKMDNIRDIGNYLIGNNPLIRKSYQLYSILRGRK